MKAVVSVGTEDLPGLILETSAPSVTHCDKRQSFLRIDGVPNRQRARISGNRDGLTWQITLAQYSNAAYENDVLSHGLSETWRSICSYILTHGEQQDGLLRIENFGELYERGLALQDKHDKKRHGQYYTPTDVARVMVEWLDKLPGSTICDVACGTGKLILEYLDFLGYERAQMLLKSGSIWLYDMDALALQICQTAVAVRYGNACAEKLNIRCCDFLSRREVLPPNAKVIANPPYAAVDAFETDWEVTDVVLQGRELYAAFLEKIWKQSTASVVITPYSFIGGAKFLPLRRLMNDYKGFVVSFDNIPGNIFIGRKHGIFNSNRGNSVRAAITVTQFTDEEKKGFRFSPLIRFKQTERTRLLTCSTLESLLGRELQLINDRNLAFAKCDVHLEPVYRRWRDFSSVTLGQYVSKVGRFEMFVPNTCRYFTVAAQGKLARSGQFTLRFTDETIYWYVFGMLNSSFAYWHWRLFDGGITYPFGLLMRLPLFVDRLSQSDNKFFREIGQEMVEISKECVVTKNNMGIQENLKYPQSYRNRLNRRLLDILGLDLSETCFDVVHANNVSEIIQ